MERQFITAGDYLVESSGKSMILEALLGTCVAVAIYDPKSKVGGLSHILLPDPNDSETTWRPKSYASSSLALFVDNLLKGGADRNNLNAVVAGGSLGLPFSQRDLNLDIGGRTTECVYQFLKRHNIPIIKSETGGCFGMKMILDTSTWKVNIEQLIPKVQVSKKIIKPTKAQISEAIKNVKPIPQITLKLIRLLQDDAYNLSEIVEELRHDQTLSAKVISYCNSAYIGSSMKIDTVERAILLLGEFHLLEIIISTSIKSLFDQQEGGYSLIRGGLFKHSLAVANLARVIAQKNKDIEPQIAYTAGLLHDIGKVVLDQYVMVSKSTYYNIELDKDGDLINFEQKTFGTDHQKIAKELAHIWNLPGNLSETMSLHHYPEEATVNPELLHIVYVADLLALWFMAGFGLERLRPVIGLEEKFKRIKLEISDISDIVAQVQWDKMMYI